MTPTEAVLSRLELVRKDSTGWMARCPAHDDRTASLHVSERADGASLLKCFAECSTETVVAAMGMTMGDLFPTKEPTRTVSATYDYLDEGGALLYQAVRFEPKGFAQRRPDASRGWLWDRNGTEPVLYALPALRSADPARTVLVVEGEKDADRLISLGFVATTNVGGAGKWRDDYSEQLRGRRVVVLPDADEPGRRHAQDVARSLRDVASEVRIVELPDLPPKGDVTDWLDAGGTVDQLKAIIKTAPPVAKVDGKGWPEPEDRGTATLSSLGDVEYVEDLLRPGRIVVWAAEEGSGKSFAVTGELAIRIATAGGSFAGTWPILRQGPVLVLSEMHSDDDYAREDVILRSLSLERSALADRYFRLWLPTAAHGEPALVVEDWRSWAVGWLKQRSALALIVDTATAATNVDPWGPEIQAVYRGLRLMQDAYPALAIILIVHLKKPQGRGERRISDVLGEWGRWCDVLVLQENDGSSLTKTKLSVRKRVRHERRIVATKRDGLLVDAQDVEPTGPKVSMDAVVAAIQASPGLTFGKLAKTLNVAPSTAAGYVATAAEQGLVDTLPGPRRSTLVYPTVHPPVVSDERAGESLDGRGGATVHRPPTYIGGQSSTGDSDLVAEARRIFGDVEVSA